MAVNATVTGNAEPDSSRCLEAFERNFAEFGDVGAAVAVYYHGRPVVDLWGGMGDPATGRPWGRETVTPVYSATKGVVAAPDKGEIPLRWLLSRRAGLPAPDKPVPPEAALNWFR